jgi:hypothetical protein
MGAVPPAHPDGSALSYSEAHLMTGSPDGSLAFRFGSDAWEKAVAKVSRCTLTLFNVSNQWVRAFTDRRPRSARIKETSSNAAVILTDFRDELIEFAKSPPEKCEHLAKSLVTVATHLRAASQLSTADDLLPFASELQCLTDSAHKAASTIWNEHARRGREWQLRNADDARVAIEGLRKKVQPNLPAPKADEIRTGVELAIATVHSLPLHWSRFPKEKPSFRAISYDNLFNAVAGVTDAGKAWAIARLVDAGILVPQYIEIQWPFTVVRADWWDTVEWWDEVNQYQDAMLVVDEPQLVNSEVVVRSTVAPPNGEVEANAVAKPLDSSVGLNAKQSAKARGNATTNGSSSKRGRPPKHTCDKQAEFAHLHLEQNKLATWAEIYQEYNCKNSKDTDANPDTIRLNYQRRYSKETDK